MGLMYDPGPFSRSPAGALDFPRSPAGTVVYLEPTPRRIRDERVDLDLDGESQERPESPWSRARVPAR